MLQLQRVQRLLLR